MTDTRDHVHGMWAGVADQWSEHADYIDAHGADLTDRMLERSQVGRGDDVLELACGPGGAGLAAAERVGPGGRVVVSDVVEAMAATAARRAAERGLTNVSSAVIDLEAIDQPDASFDVVLCREGLMFAVEPARAAGEICRVLRPDGRAAVAVRAGPERNPWLSVALEAIGDELGVTIPPPGIPGPFSLSDPGALVGALTEGGLTDVVVDEVSVPRSVPSFETWWARTADLAGPAASILAALPDEAKASITERLRVATQPYVTANAIEFPGLSLLASGRRA